MRNSLKNIYLGLLCLFNIQRKVSANDAGIYFDSLIAIDSCGTDAVGGCK